MARHPSACKISWNIMELYGTYIISPSRMPWDETPEGILLMPLLSSLTDAPASPSLSSLRPVQACGWSLRHKAGSCGWAEPIWLPFLAMVLHGTTWYHVVPSTVFLCTSPIFWGHFPTSPLSPGSSFQESREAWILRSSPWVCHGQDFTYSQPHQTWSNFQLHLGCFQLHLGWATKHQTFHGRTSKQPHQRVDSPGLV